MSTQARRLLMSVLLGVVLLGGTAFAFEPPVGLQVGDCVWFDANGDGKFANADGTVQEGEYGLNGVTLRLTGTATNGDLVDVTTTTATSAYPTSQPFKEGWYTFTQVKPGDYTVTVVSGLPAGLTQTYDLDGLNTPEAASFSLPQTRMDVDFGYNNAPVPVLISISGHVYYDCDADGVLDSGESLLGATRVALYAGSDTSGTPLAVVEPASDGLFAFNDLPQGTYTVVETNLAGYRSTNAIGGVSGTKVNNDAITVNATLEDVLTYPNQDFLDTKDKPGIKIEKTGPATACAGSTITYHFKITNTGGVTLTNVKVDDPLLGGIIKTYSSLAPGQVVEFDKTYTIPRTSYSSSSYGSYGWSCYGDWDDDCGSTTTKVVNTATVTGYYSCYYKVTSTSTWTTTIASGDSCKSPDIDLVKTGPATATAGSTITYHFKITNSGNMTLTYVKVNDPLLGGTIKTYNSLAPGQVVEFDRTYTIPSSSYSSGSYGGYGWNCTGSYGDWGDWGDRCGSTTTKVVNTATVTGYYSCYYKVSSTSTWTTTVTSSSSGSCGGWDWDDGCDWDDGWGDSCGWGDGWGSSWGWGDGWGGGSYGSGSYGGSYSGSGSTCLNR